MSTELFANDYITTLAASCGSGDTSITLTQAPPSGLSASGQWRLLIDSEILLVTAVSGSVCTVTRGQEGTNAASHAAATSATHILTAGALGNITPSGGVSTGTFADLPTAGQAGRLYLSNESPFVLEDDGSEWNAFAPVYPVSIPKSSDFSWANQGSATIESTQGGIYLSVPGTNSGDNIIMQVQAIPTAPYTITLGLIANYPILAASYGGGGMVLRDSGTGKIATFIPWFRGGGLSGADAGFIFMQLDKYSGPTSFSSTYLQLPITLPGAIAWLRIRDDGTDRYYQMSGDGVHFRTIYSVSNTDYLTPNQIGFGYTVNGSEADTVGMYAIHWHVSDS